MILRLVAVLAAEDWHYRRAFERFKQRYDKSYAPVLEERTAFANFVDNVRMIEGFNRTGDRSYTLNVNENSDQALGRHPRGLQAIPDLERIGRLEQQQLKRLRGVD